jgi:hypothetical protein
MESQRTTDIVKFAKMLVGIIKKIEGKWKVFKISAHDDKGNVYIRIRKAKEPSITRLIVYTTTGNWVVSPEESEEI